MVITLTVDQYLVSSTINSSESTVEVIVMEVAIYIVGIVFVSVTSAKNAIHRINCLVL